MGATGNIFFPAGKTLAWNSEKGVWTQDWLAFCSWQTNRSILLWFWTSYTYQEVLISCDSWCNYCMCSLKEFPCSFFACRVSGLGKMGWLLGDGPRPCAVFIELSVAFCPEKYHDKPIFPKATPDEQLCRAIHCLEVRRSKTVNTLLLLREKLKAYISEACKELKTLWGCCCGSAQAQLLWGFKEDLSGTLCPFQRPCSWYCCSSVSSACQVSTSLYCRQHVNAHLCPAVETACVCLTNMAVEKAVVDNAGKNTEW